MNRWAAIGVCCALGLSSACGDDAGRDSGDRDGGAPDAGAQPSADDELSFETFDSTHVLSDAALSELAEAAPDGTLRFTGTPEELTGLEPMQVLIGEPTETAPHGLLRLVTAVSQDDRGLVLETVHAPIQLAFRKLHVRFSRSTDAAAMPQFSAPGVGAQSAPLWAAEPIDEYVFNGDDDPQTPLDQVHVTGSLAGGFDYTFGLDVDWGDVYDIPGEVLDCIGSVLTGSFECSPYDLLPEAVVGLEFKAGADAELGLEGVAFLDYSKESVLAEAALDWLKLGPLWFRPVVEVRGGFSGAASSQFKLGARATATAETSIRFSSESGGSLVAPAIEKKFEAPTVEASLTAEAKVRVGPRLHLRLFDTMGPFASLYAFAELTADRGADPCYQLYGGIEGDVGFTIATPDLPVVGRLLLLSYQEGFGVAKAQIDDGACALVGELDPAAQAGLAEQEAFSNPSFEPWAASFDAVVDGYPHEGLGAQIEWSAMTPSIDGRFLVTGSDAAALLKLDADGELVWARRYVADVPFWLDTQKPDLLASAVVSTADAGLMLVGHPYTLVKLDQAGEVQWAKHFELPYYRETWWRFRDAVSDGEGGFYVAGTYGPEDPSQLSQTDIWLLRVNGAGEVLWSRRIGDATHGEITRALVRVDDGVVVAGSEWTDDGALWRGLAARFTEDGELRWGTRLIADDCGGGFEQDFHLTSGLLSGDGDLVFAAGGQYRGYEGGTLKLKADDGSLAWSAFLRASESNHLGPQTTSIVQLPTSGFLVAGFYIGAQTAQDIFVAGLDSVGRVQWAQLYGGKNDDMDTGVNDDTYPSIVLTRDGGALVTAYSEALGDPNGLWTMKIAAKDGAITFAGAGRAAGADVVFTEGGECLSDQAWSPPVQPLQVPLDALSVRSEVLAPAAHRLTP